MCLEKEQHLIPQLNIKLHAKKKKKTDTGHNIYKYITSE